MKYNLYATLLLCSCLLSANEIERDFAIYESNKHVIIIPNNTFIRSCDLGFPDIISFYTDKKRYSYYFFKLPETSNQDLKTSWEVLSNNNVGIDKLAKIISPFSKYKILSKSEKYIYIQSLNKNASPQRSILIKNNLGIYIAKEYLIKGTPDDDDVICPKVTPNELFRKLKLLKNERDSRL
jgi:hypothetical protein